MKDRALGGCIDRLVPLVALEEGTTTDRTQQCALRDRAGRVRLVQIGQRSVLGGESADPAQRGDVPIHRVDRLAGHDAGLRPPYPLFGENQ